MHQAAIVELLDEYASNAMGGAKNPSNWKKENRPDADIRGQVAGDRAG